MKNITNNNNKKKKKNQTIYIILPKSAHVKYYDSETK